MNVVYLTPKRLPPALRPPLDLKMLRVHVLNSDPESALHGEPAARPRTSWLTVSIVLIGLAVLVWCYARWLWSP